MTTIRKGQVAPFVPREIFKQRFQQSFYDPAFDKEKEAIGVISRDTPSIRRVASAAKFSPITLETNGKLREARRLHSITFTAL